MRSGTSFRCPSACTLGSASIGANFSRYAGRMSPAIKKVPLEEAEESSHASSAMWSPLRTAA